MKPIYEGVQNNEQECLDRVAFEIGKSVDDTITITLRRIAASDRVPEHWAVRATAGEGNIEEDPPCPAEDDGPIPEYLVYKHVAYGYNPVTGKVGPL